MAEPAREIHVLGFRTTLYTKREPRNPDGSPGKVIEENAPDYWVKYVNRTTPQSKVTEDRLRHMDPATARFAEGAENSEKIEFLTWRWNQIKPAFDAWLAGNAMPEYGIPIDAWAALNADQIKVFKASGIKSVEDVRDMSEDQLMRIRLPGLRDLKRLAGTYLEGLSGREVTDKLEAQQAEIDGLKESLAAAMALLEEQAKANAETVGGKKAKAA